MTDLDELKLSLLQLQRSALIDTQTIMQILIDKGICEVADIMDTRYKIESSSEDVKRIDEAILEGGGSIVQVSDPKSEVNKRIDELEALLKKMINP